MEDHTTTDATLRVFELLRREFDNVGVVLQARLRRTPGDIAKLAPGPLHVRMVKGIYSNRRDSAHAAVPIRVALRRVQRLLFGAQRVFRSRRTTATWRTVDRVTPGNTAFARTQYEFQVLPACKRAWGASEAGAHRGV